MPYFLFPVAGEVNFMNYPTVFHLISDITKKTGTTCVLIGGFAVNYYKVTRQTVDVDFLITEEGFEKILNLLEEAGYKRTFSQKVFTRFKNTSNDYLLMDIDFMFVDKDTLDKILKDGKEMKIAGQDFIIPSLNTLIALKLHALKHNFELRKNKDIPDIINLISINKVDFKSNEFRQHCLKYGTEEIYNKILERI